MRLDPPYMHEPCELRGCVQLLNGVEKSLEYLNIQLLFESILGLSKSVRY
jgi:hypothetical protein